MAKDYGSWTLAELKAELRKRNAKLTGKKAVLVKRLEDHDKLFGPLITEPETVYKITLPAPELFRDVTSSTIMPSLDIDEMESFCRLAERENVVTSGNMYNEFFLTACRLAQINNEYYVTGVVLSEMRKNIQYNVSIKLKSHTILEAQCECAAGMGPYAQCKHVLVVIFAIIDMNNSKTIKVKGSATSSLQTFHRPTKLHTGDPVTAEELSLKYNDNKYKDMVSFDPRQVTQSAEEYRSFFKKSVANFCGHTSHRSMPISQILLPADKKSIYKDHDYLPSTQEQEFLENMKLSQEERHSLERKTREDKKLWKSQRLMRMNSSQFGQICKANNKMKLAKSLVKNADIATPAIKHGIMYENEAVREFENVMQISTEKCGIIVFKEHQFLASTPDRLVGSNCVLEVKCPYTAKDKMISPETVPYLYLLSWSSTKRRQLASVMMYLSY